MKSRVMCQDGLGLVAVGAAPPEERSVMYFQAFTYSRASRAKVGHQNRDPGNDMVHWIPG